MPVVNTAMFKSTFARMLVSLLFYQVDTCHTDAYI